MSRVRSSQREVDLMSKVSMAIRVLCLENKKGVSVNTNPLTVLCPPLHVLARGDHVILVYFRKIATGFLVSLRTRSFEGAWLQDFRRC